jgi:SAM-dependent methyltransferase
MTDRSSVLRRLASPDFPRTNGYDPDWIVRNQMGPHPLWLMEWLTELLPIASGMRVLDLGCGTALTSIFLAREFGARVVAADLWIEPSANQKRIAEAGVDELVTPLRVEAHRLPFADAHFDVVVSVDAYHYFGTDELYLGWHLARVVGPGSRIGIVVPGFTHELDEVPESLADRWDPDFWSFHTPAWWRRHFEHSGTVDVEVADARSDGWELWHRWAGVLHELGAGAAPDAPVPPDDPDDLALLEADTTRLLTFTRVVARSLREPRSDAPPSRSPGRSPVTAEPRLEAP